MKSLEVGTPSDEPCSHQSPLSLCAGLCFSIRACVWSACVSVLVFAYLCADSWVCLCRHIGAHVCEGQRLF